MTTKPQNESVAESASDAAVNLSDAQLDGVSGGARKPSRAIIDRLDEEDRRLKEIEDKYADIIKNRPAPK